jgi:hypothetical protein
MSHALFKLKSGSAKTVADRIRIFRQIVARIVINFNTKYESSFMRLAYQIGARKLLRTWKNKSYKNFLR